MQVPSDTLIHLPTGDALPFDLEGPPRAGGENAIRFGRFCALPHSRQLLLDGNPCEIGGRAFDLLMLLLRSRGSIVSKEEIFDAVWPSMVVEECNLRFQIGSLRRALGDHRDMIKTIVRRGYMLVQQGAAEEIEPATPSTARTRMPLGSEMEKPYVALIEDEDGVRHAIARLLRSVGLAVGTFASVAAYEESDTLYRADCLILDVCLPGRSGLDFQAELIKSGLRQRIVFISGHADIPMSVRAMKAGAVEFLTKPVRYQDLLSAVDLAINS
ncbi:response regulator [Mesorhizobium sp. M2E.F.Ca.ET.209.01.1.1]|uniref:response regulator n=1 Tax=Mesorhizobium sp. M2E.F.Ca.ET.209.01.1.1 TaxID=2500526 RepID=UPI000FD7062A|nr:response regulator [Mesorhizobium sp. M2E.F.Ca.ET.209.01.1.1]TGS16843.1 response regulator [Mesorhizobium sp. M2E.F.Ca.ET.209.01.1.1]